MNKAFEKILEMLEENQTIVFNLGGGKPKQSIDYSKAVEIVQEVAEEYKSTEYINCSTDTSTDGWIPTYEKLPPDDSYILLSFSNFSIPIVGRYEEDEEGGGNFFAGDEDEPLISHDMYVNAWMPLPKCYKESEV